LIRDKVGVHLLVDLLHQRLLFSSDSQGLHLVEHRMEPGLEVLERNGPDIGERMELQVSLPVVGEEFDPQPLGEPDTLDRVLEGGRHSVQIARQQQERADGRKHDDSQQAEDDVEKGLEAHGVIAPLLRREQARVGNSFRAPVRGGSKELSARSRPGRCG
jgi:hypothetical protein